MKLTHKNILSIVSAIFLVIPMVFADSQNPEYIVRAFGDVLKNAKTFRVKFTSITKMEAEGMKHEYLTKNTLTVSKPSKIASVLDYGIMGSTIISDGRKVFRYMPMAGSYTEEKSPKDLVSVFTDGGPETGLGVFPVLVALVSDDPASEMLEGTSGGVYLGSRNLDGVLCHVVKFKQNGFDWEAWFEAGTKPLLRKVVPDVNGLMKNDSVPNAGMKGLKYEMTYLFDAWELDLKVNENTFTFKPPSGVVKVDSLFGLNDIEDEEEIEILGKKAPDFSLKLLDGTSLKLSEKRGKIVVLEFWASWCPPCRKLMPMIEDLANEFSGKDVLFFALNQEEDIETINDFIKENKIKLNVALDSKGHVASSLGIKGIPSIIVIDKDGVVKYSYGGFSKDLLKDLRKAIEDLL